MTQLLPLNNELHKELKVDTDQCNLHHANTNMVPVVIDEFLKLITQFPIVMTKNSETGRFVCVALLGFQEGENLFWQSGRLDSLYVPLNLERSPFFMDYRNDDELIMCVDMDNPGVQEEKGLALFDSNGAQTDYLRHGSQVLAALYDGEKNTQAFVQLLVELDLIMPIKIDIELQDQSKIEVNGLYSINEDNLKRLSCETIQSLLETNYLRAIYAMVTSLSHMSGLIKRSNNKINSSAF